MDTQNHIRYRADIDGLRAIAVMIVLLFHAYPNWVHGGFIGVDVFFVISGYLISSIIFKGLKQGSFNFREFYVRRVRRIFPALFCVILVTLLLGWFLLLSDEFQQLAKHAMGGLGFVSNFVLYGEAGYFDGFSDRKPLLHLWSLGIEEQFYFVWPLFLWLSWKRGWNIYKSLIAIVVLSFALNCILVRHSPTSAFYLPLTRIWEPLFGSALAYFAIFNSKVEAHPRRYFLLQQRFGNLRSVLGLGLLVAGLVWIDPDSSFPGCWAMIPVLSAWLIISAGESSWANRRFLSNPILRWIGVISFPLYLWHWPLIAFSRILLGGQPEPVLATALLIASFILAAMTYYFVETPLRFKKTSKVSTFTLCMAMVLIGIIASVIYFDNGVPSRHIAKLNGVITSGDDGGDLGFSTEGCGLKTDSEKFGVCKHDRRSEHPKYALLGDSKAAALYEGLVRTSTEKGRWVFMGGRKLGLAAIEIQPGERRFESFKRLNRSAVAQIAQNKVIEDVVFAIASRELFDLKNDHSIEDLPASKNFDVAFADLNSLVQPLVHSGKKVVLLVDNPTLPDARDCIERETGFRVLDSYIKSKFEARCHIRIDRQLELSKKYRELLNAIKNTAPSKIQVFESLGYMCDPSRGSCDAVKDGRLMYSYTDHVSDFAAGLIGRDLNQMLNQ